MKSLLDVKSKHLARFRLAEVLIFHESATALTLIYQLFCIYNALYDNSAVSILVTEKEKAEIKGKIINQIQSLKTEIAGHEEMAKPVAPDNAIGRLTRMEAINARAIHEASLHAAKLKLAKLQNTLKRIDSPDFGICALCEEPIAFKRLLLIPESAKCVNCADT